MTDITPPWLDAGSSAEVDQPALLPGRWVKGMPSPNRAGRPRGIVDRRSKLAERMLADADGIVATMVEKALEGDSGAAHLILGRVLPTLRSRSEKVQFALSPDAPLAAQAQQILEAVAAGEVDPDTGKMLIGCIQSVAGIRAVEDLEGRLIILEQRDAR